MTAVIAGAFDQVCARRHPAPVSDEDLHELFQAVELVDPETTPDYVERFDEWAAEYRADLDAERGGR